MKLFKLTVIISFSLLFLTGCWDRAELSEVSIVTGVAIDKGKTKKYRLTIETTEAREMNYQTATGMAPSFVYSLEGDEVGEIAHKFNISNASRLVYSHMRLLAISQEVAETGTMDFMDFFDRNREMRDDFSIVIVRGQDAGSLLEVTNMYKKSPSLKIFTQLNTMQKEWGGAPDIKLNDFVRLYNAQGQSPVLAAARLIGDPKKGGNVENLKSEVPESSVVIDSIGVIKNGKLVGFATLKEVRDMLFIQGRIKNTELTVKCIKGDKKFGYRITSTKTKVTAKEKNGIPTFHVKIKAEGYLESTGCTNEFKKESAFEGQEKAINKMMEDEIMRFINKSREEYNADIFGFGEFLREQDYKHFKKYGVQWDQGFAKADINITFAAEVKRTGLRSNPYMMK